MPTLQNLVDRVRQEVAGFSQNQQQFTYLTSSIGTTDTSLSVFDATQVSRGQIEVDGLELMLVKSVNSSTNTITLDPFGRGWAGTTAASHALNARIENNPIWPTIRITEAINDTIRSVYPQLFAVATTSITKISVVYEYQLPADCEEVISVQNQLIGPSKVWPFCRSWRFVGQANTTDFPNAKALFIADDIVPGRIIWVTYRKEPSELVNLTDDFATVTGLPATSQDVIVWGACARLTVQLEGPRLALAAVEASERSQYVQPGSASRVASYFDQKYEIRLEQEAAKLRDRYQAPTHYDF
jgi:hypothetical protein